MPTLPAIIRPTCMPVAISRAAQWLMRVHDDPDVMRRVHQADVEIDRAIGEMDQAARFDHKDLDDHPHIDANLDRPGRFRKAMELLQRARADIAREEDNPSAIGWRDIAYRHIDAAMNFVRHAAHDLHMERSPQNLRHPTWWMAREYGLFPGQTPSASTSTRTRWISPISAITTFPPAEA